MRRWTPHQRYSISSNSKLQRVSEIAVRRHMVLLVTAVVLAFPASAQFYPAPGPGPRRSPPEVATTVSRPSSAGPQVGRVYSDIDEGKRAGQLTHRQARALRREAGEITTLE